MSCLDYRVDTIFKESEYTFFGLYGSYERTLVGCGIDDEITLFGSDDDIWEQLKSWLDHHTSNCIFGYTGFSASSGEDDVSNPSLRFIVPKLVVEYTRDRTLIHQGSSDWLRSKPCIKDGDSFYGAQNNLRPFSSVAYWDSDISRHQQYMSGISEVSHYTNAGALERLTLARRIKLPAKVDLLETLRCRNLINDHRARSFVWRESDLKFVGVNPELLAVGNLEKFSTYKLSGTR